MKNYYRLFAVSFLFNLLLSVIFIVFNDSIIERSDIAILVGIGNIILSSFAFGFASLSIFLYKMYLRNKKIDQKS